MTPWPTKTQIRRAMSAAAADGAVVIRDVIVSPGQVRIVTAPAEAAARLDAAV